MSRQRRIWQGVIAVSLLTGFSRPLLSQKVPGMVVSTSGEIIAMAKPAILVHLVEPDVSRPNERVAKAIVLLLSGRFPGASGTWHQPVGIRAADIQQLTLSGDWCASPPTGGLEVRLRDGTRHSLAAAGPTNYQEVHAKVQPGVFDKDMPIDSWELQGEVQKGVGGAPVPSVVVAITGVTATGSVQRVPLCQVRTATFP